MKAYNSVTASAVTLPVANVDTDQLIPARFMKRPRSEGYGRFLLYDLRNSENNNNNNPATKLDAPLFAGVEIIIARRNFGCGSSREAAVYALVDFGIRCVIAPSFGDIFASNSVKNGLLTAIVDEQICEMLLNDPSIGNGLPITVDLATQRITAGVHSIEFSIDATSREQLLNGWDDIDLTMARQTSVEQWRAADLERRPWASL